MMRRLVPLLFLFTTISAAPALRRAAHAHPDFSGTWAFDATKSEGPMLPTSAQLKVTQTEKTLTVERTATTMAGTQTATFNYALDGSVSKNTGGGGGMTVEFTSTTEWDGEVLVIKTTANLSTAFSQTERWTLAADKKVLTQDGQISVGTQSATAKLTYNKQ
jgi:hypothetical protein